MPLVRIEACKARPEPEIAALMDAVHAAQRAAFQVPEDDRTIRYVAYPPGHFPPPPGKSDAYLLIEFTVFPGRSPAAKRRLHAELFERLGALGIAPHDLLVVLHEPPLENWGIRGRAACDIDLGFRLDV